jgi:serine-type D-Ala-D-Ala carboxypeptidase (penicillin-binding protein 5/6)
MRVLDEPKKRTHKGRWIVLLLIVVAYAMYAGLRPITVPLTVTSSITQKSTSQAVSIPWPTVGQAAYGAVGYGVLATHGIDSPTPMASVAKVVTALSILNKKPIALGETGPTLTFTADDVAIYNQYVSNDGSTVPVTVGEKMTEYQALQAMMLPSANNIADTLAIWAFGSLEAYATYASTYVAGLGMTHTTIADASGFSANSASTADDLILLGQAALQNPTLAQIVGQKSAESPSGAFANVDTILGESGIVGIKTGNTDAAGGVFLGAANITVNNQPLTVITAVMHTTTLDSALSSTLPLVKAGPDSFSFKSVLTAGDSVGKATAPWGSWSGIIVKNNVGLIAWNQTILTPTATTGKILSSAVAQTVVGKVSLSDHSTSATSDIVLANKVAGPNFWWRLTHPIN